MSNARRIRRGKERSSQKHSAYLAELLGGFLELLSGIKTKTLTPVDFTRLNESGNFQPTAEEIRAEFLARNNKWLKYCKHSQLINADKLFMVNVAEAWKHNTQQITTE